MPQESCAWALTSLLQCTESSLLPMQAAATAAKEKREFDEVRLPVRYTVHIYDVSYREGCVCQARKSQLLKQPMTTQHSPKWNKCTRTSPFLRHVISIQCVFYRQRCLYIVSHGIRSPYARNMRASADCSECFSLDSIIYRKPSL